MLFELFDLSAHTINDGPFVVWDQHVILAEGNAGAEGFTETQSHHMVTENHRFFLTTVAIDRIDDLLNFALFQKAVHQAEGRLSVLRQQSAQTHAARCGFKPHHNLIALIINLRNARLDFRMKMHNPRIKRVLNFIHGAKNHAFALHAFTHQGGIIKAQDHIL